MEFWKFVGAVREPPWAHHDAPLLYWIEKYIAENPLHWNEDEENPWKQKVLK